MNEAPPQTSPPPYIDRLRADVEGALDALVPETDPPELYAPVRYVLEGGGKRVRPVVLLLAADIFGAERANALPAAVAVEVFHNFTLVHDDIMDHADERRGRPTVHVTWDESTAILCGDYLMALAYQQLGQVRTERLARLIEVFHHMVTRLCVGQTLDKAFETRAEVSVEQYLDMIDAKTGALLQAALELGGLIGGADEEHLEALRLVGLHVGRAFQIQDDLLDLTAEDARWGKVIGGDLMEGKKTFLLLRALERADGADHAWFARILEGSGLPAADVAEARTRMERLGVLQEARAAVESHTSAAERYLSSLPETPAREALRWLFQRMQARNH